MAPSRALRLPVAPTFEISNDNGELNDDDDDNGIEEAPVSRSPVVIRRSRIGILGRLQCISLCARLRLNCSLPPAM